MSAITIQEKPESISYDALYRVLQKAHEENRRQGILANLLISDGQALKAHIGPDGVCFVAMDGENVVGIVAAKPSPEKAWCSRQMRLIHLMHLSVLPEYAGQGIGGQLCGAVEQYAADQQADGVDLYVIEKNPARTFYLRRGYRPIHYRIRKTGQQSVYMIKWLRHCPWPAWQLRFRYICSKAKQLAKKPLRRFLKKGGK